MHACIHCITLHCIALHGMALHCIAYIALHYTTTLHALHTLPTLHQLHKPYIYIHIHNLHQFTRNTQITHDIYVTGILYIARTASHHIKLKILHYITSRYVTLCYITLYKYI